jgi:NAD(P)-dependent dehydrogenase (short-subunit alcohol dehydrogenase family)
LVVAGEEISKYSSKIKTRMTILASMSVKKLEIGDNMQALITGANRGLGLEFVKQLAARGDRVFATCRKPAEAKALKDLQKKYGGLISITLLDVSDPSSIAESYTAISAQTDSLDLLVNNAATALDDGGLGGFEQDKMQMILTINAIAPMLVTQQYLDLVKAGSQPKIINISSGAGSLTLRNSLASYSYGASKAALNFYTRNLSHNLKDAGVIVIALGPGWVKTDMGGPNAQITPEESIGGMLQVIDHLTLDDSGGFLNYTGAVVPW